MVCLADDSHEVPSLIFSEKKVEFCTVQICLVLKELSIENMHFGIKLTKTRLYNFDPLKPHFYIIKLGFTGVYIIYFFFFFIFFFLLQYMDCGYSLEPPRRSGSNEYHNLYLSKNTKNIRIFHLPFLVVKFSIYLNRRAFVMD